MRWGWSLSDYLNSLNCPMSILVHVWKRDNWRRASEVLFNSLVYEFNEFFPSKQRFTIEGENKQQTLNLSLSLFLHRRGLISIPIRGWSKYSRKGIWNRSTRFTKERFENLSSRAESALWLTRIESSNQSPLISPISRIAWLPEQECMDGIGQGCNEC